MKKIYEKVMGWFRGIGIDKYWHFILGLIIASFFEMVLDMQICIVPVLFAGFIKEAFYEWRYGGFDWRDFAATILGGLIIQLFVYL